MRIFLFFLALPLITNGQLPAGYVRATAVDNLANTRQLSFSQQSFSGSRFADVAPSSSASNNNNNNLDDSAKALLNSEATKWPIPPTVPPRARLPVPPPVPQRPRDRSDGEVAGGDNLRMEGIVI